MKGYAYLDKYGILHAVADEATAREYGRNNVVEFEGPFGGGYLKTEDGKTIVYYNEDKQLFIDGNCKSGKAGELENYPLVKEIIEALTK